MKQPTPIECTLCATPAYVHAMPNFGKYSAIACAACGEFVVSDTAADRIKGLPNEFKDHWRAMIRSAKSDEVLLITVEPVGSGGGLKQELVPRRSLSL